MAANIFAAFLESSRHIVFMHIYLVSNKNQSTHNSPERK